MGGLGREMARAVAHGGGRHQGAVHGADYRLADRSGMAKVAYLGDAGTDGAKTSPPGARAWREVGLTTPTPPLAVRSMVTKWERWARKTNSSGSANSSSPKPRRGTRGVGAVGTRAQTTKRDETGARGRGCGGGRQGAHRDRSGLGWVEIRSAHARHCVGGPTSGGHRRCSRHRCCSGFAYCTWDTSRVSDVRTRPSNSSLSNILA